MRDRAKSFFMRINFLINIRYYQIVNKCNKIMIKQIVSTIYADILTLFYDFIALVIKVNMANIA